VFEGFKLEIKIVSYMGNARMLIARDMTLIIKLQQMRRDFVANVSHELRTPLTVLRGYMEMFSDETAHDQWQKALPSMRQQADRMSNMLQELLILSRLESGDKPLNLVSVDIDIIIEVTATAIQHKILHNYFTATAVIYHNDFCQSLIGSCHYHFSTF